MDIVPLYIICGIIFLILIWLCRQSSSIGNESYRHKRGYLRRRRKRVYSDKYGYLRYSDTDRFVHRDVAYKGGLRHKSLPFGKCQVHHIDGNKLNNDLSNLQVVSRKEHEKIHHIFITVKGQRYHKLCRLHKIYRETPLSVLCAGVWIPKKFVTVQENYLYVRVFFYNKHFK